MRRYILQYHSDLVYNIDGIESYDAKEDAMQAFREIQIRLQMLADRCVSSDLLCFTADVSVIEPDTETTIAKWSIIV